MREDIGRLAKSHRALYSARGWLLWNRNKKERLRRMKKAKMASKSRRINRR